MQPKMKPIVKRLTPHKITNKFTLHPHLNGMTYIQHFAFSTRLGLRLGRLVVVAITHAIFPWIWKREVSTTINSLSRGFRVKR
jgi:hypothetical protein